jgi:hypothetical protein
MLSDIDGMLQSLYVLNNAPVKREGNGNPADPFVEDGRNPVDIGTARHVENPVIDALPFQVTVKSHEEVTSSVWNNKTKRPVGVVLSPTVETTTGGVPKYSYSIEAGKCIQTYFRKKTSTTSPFNLRVAYVDKNGNEEQAETIPIKDEETETPYPLVLSGSDVDGWNIYHTGRLILQIRFHA